MASIEFAADKRFIIVAANKLIKSDVAEVASNRARQVPGIVTGEVAMFELSFGKLCRNQERSFIATGEASFGIAAGQAIVRSLSCCYR